MGRVISFLYGAVAYIIFLGTFLYAIAFVGDDLPDLAAFQEADVCIAPANAHPAVKAAADLVLCRRGGHEAVRELAELIRAAKGIGPMAGLLS